MVMIPKAEAYKWRLIAMLCTMYRVWARRAGEDVSVWMKGLNRSWIANGPGKSSEHAAYDIAIDTEGHNNNPEVVDITIMDDLEKGFEKVVHNKIREKAHVFGFPPAKMELALSMYSAGRRVRCGKAHSEPVKTKIGVLAGCPIAMGLLLLSVIDPVDIFWKKSPAYMTSLRVYVDDFALSFRFNKSMHTRDLMRMKVANAYRELEKAIIGEGANFAKGKGKIVASDSEVADSIVDELNQDKCTARTIVAEKAITVLGVDYSAGKPVTYCKMKSRLKAANAKAAKINAIAKGGWRKVNIMRSHVVSAVAYSARVNGMPNDIMEKLRTMVRSATSTRAGGGSAAMDMMLQKSKHADPLHDANVLPLMEWVVRINTAVYKGDNAAIEKYKRAWYNGIASIYVKHNEDEQFDLWKNVRGPASACIFTLLKIKWTPASCEGWKCWQNRDGNVIDISLHPPASVKH